MVAQLELREQSQILTEIDGISELHCVVVLSATNRPDMVDPALLRLGRFDRIILVLNPDSQTRAKILEIHINGKLIGKDVNIEKIAQTMT